MAEEEVCPSPVDWMAEAESRPSSGCWNVFFQCLAEAGVVYACRTAGNYELWAEKYKNPDMNSTYL